MHNTNGLMKSVIHYLVSCVSDILSQICPQTTGRLPGLDDVVHLCVLQIGRQASCRPGQGQTCFRGVGDGGSASRHSRWHCVMETMSEQLKKIIQSAALSLYGLFWCGKAGQFDSSLSNKTSIPGIFCARMACKLHLESVTCNNEKQERQERKTV